MRKLNNYMAAVTLVLFLASMLLMAGCAPYAEYQHLSHPRVSNDGFDLLCGGGQAEKHGLLLHAGACKDVTGYKGEYVRVGMRYVWD